MVVSKIISKSDIEDALLQQTINGKSDGYKNLKDFRTSEVINQMLIDSFGLEIPD
ncbi:MAG: hypothetical protein LBS50_08530 [Prevotellaceae bacterium]|jgi:hypothetical protein|nr:hypothetical protein [Prevotellaceae bacterium]